MSYNPLVPRGCYPRDEFTTTRTDENGTVFVEEHVVYYHPTHGIFGSLIANYENGVFVGEEWLSYDPSL
jgi:hypothetical protein